MTVTKLSRTRALIAAAALVGIGFVALAALHLPPVQTVVGRAALRWVGPRLGVVATAQRFSFNLLTLDVHLRGVTAAAEGWNHQPFLTADQVLANVPWRALFGTPAVESIEVAGATISIVRARDGRLNLPGSAADNDAGTTSPMEAGRVVVRQTDVRYVDVASDLTIEVDDIAVEMTPTRGGNIAGRLTTVRGPAIRAGDFAVDGSLAGLLSYDGSSLGLTDLVFTSNLARLRVDGRLNTLWSAPTAALAATGAISLADVSSMLPVADPVSGSMALKATVEGPLDAPRVPFTLTSNAVAWRHVQASAFTAGGTLDASTLQISTSTARMAGGTVTANGEVRFSPLRTTATAELRGLSARSLVGPSAPVDIAAVLGGRGRADWAVANGLSGLATTIDLRAQPGTGGPNSFGVGGSMGFTVMDGRWRLRLDNELSGALSVTGDLQGTVNEAALMNTSVAGLLTVSATDLSRADRLLRAAGVEWPAWSAPEGGGLSARAQIGGTLQRPTAAGEASLHDLRIGGSVPLTLDGAFVASMNAVQFPTVHAALGANVADGTAEINVGSGALKGAFDFAIPDAAALGDAVERWHPAGQLTGRVELSGTQASPIVHGTASSASLGFAGQAMGGAALALSYSDGVATMSRFQIEQPAGGRLQATGTYDPRSERHTLTLEARSFVVSPVTTGDDTLPVHTTIDGTLETSGTLEQPTGGGRLVLTTAGWRDTQVDRAEADIELSNAGIAATVRAPTLSLLATALVKPVSPYGFTLNLATEGTNVGELLRAVGTEAPTSVQQFAGTASARLNATGSLEDLAHATADINLTALDVQSGNASLRLTSPAAARYDASTLSVRSLQLATGHTTIALSGTIARAGTSPGLDLAINGDLADVGPWLTLVGLPSDLTASGAVSAHLLASGSVDAADVTGRVRLNNGSIGWPGYPAATAVNLSATFENDAVVVTEFTGGWEGAIATGQARVPLLLLAEWLPSPIVAGLPGSAAPAPASLTARVDNVTPAALAPFAGHALDDALTGRASLQIDLSADAPTLDRLNGSIVMDEFDFVAEGLPLGQARPTRVNVVQGELRVADWTWTMAGSRVQVGGRARLAGDRTLDLNVGGQLDLRVVGAFLPDIATAGVGDLSVAVRGTMASPLADGFVQLRDGELRLEGPQIGVSDARGRILLGANRLELSGLEGDLNGGRFAMIGGLEYQGLTLTGGSISIDSRNVALNVPEGMRTEVDAAIAVAFANRIQVSGRVEVIRGAYREPLSLAVGVATATRNRATASGVGVGGTSALERLDLNVAVASATDLIVDNNYGRMDLGLDVRLVGTAAQPSIVGRAIIRDGGTLFLGGRSYLIERGVIDFANPRAIVPELDLLARTRLRGPDEGGQGTEYDISLELTGTPENLQATLSSDPVRSEADIVSLLATGQLADQAGGIGGAAATEQAIALLSGEALGFAAQVIGVDSIRIERDPALDAFAANPAVAAEVNPAQRLTVSRRINDVEVTLSQNLRDQGRFTWILGYTPIRTVELRTLARDDRSRSYEMRHDLSFGGVPRPATPRGPDARDTSRVARVRLTGDLRFPVAEVEGMLGLHAGDRFDFYRWQEGRTRLRRFYLDRRHLEVRISARRVESADDSVALEYDIQAGPVAHLDITGHRLPGDAVRELEDIWSNTVIEVALTADLRAAVRRHMVEQGHLQAVVEVSQLTSDDADKRVRVAITPGPAVSSRRVEFSGNDRLSSSALQEAAARLGGEIWLRPAGLADEVALLYHAEGLLAARVVAGPVNVTSDQAVLPVRIEEGVQFRIARVVVSGATARPASDVRAELGLAPESPYTPAVVQQARGAVDRAYDKNGFTSMTSTVETVADAASATVDVRLAIDEGPQQRLEAIAVTGAEDVQPGVISSALGLSTGTPVDMDAWYAGRRRLFRTGLFQRVDVEPVPVDEPGPTGVRSVRARVTLVRRAPYRLRYGVDVTDETAPLADRGRVLGAGVSANLERYGLFGRAGTVGTSVRVNNDQRIGRGFLTLPAFLGREVTSRLFASRSREFIEGADILSVVVDKTAFTAEQRFRIRKNLEFAYGYQLERNHTFDPNADPDNPFALDNFVQAARVTTTVIFDTRSDPFAPGRGWFHSSTVEYAPERLGSDARFAKYSLQQFFFAEVAPRVVSASAVRIGVGRGFGQRLLITERFLSGGANTVRGYPTDALGGYDYFGGPVRGEAVVVLNQEVRFPIFRWVSGAGFVDAGEVFDRPGEMSLGTLDVGVGGGLRLSTPVGLFRLDLATPAPRKERNLHWYVAFGHTF